MLSRIIQRGLEADQKETKGDILMLLSREGLYVGKFILYLFIVFLLLLYKTNNGYHFISGNRSG